MRTRFFQFTGSPEANEGTGMNSSFSTERSPTTALLFEATRTVLLPVVRMADDMPAVEVLSEAQSKVDCSVQDVQE
jgi:hypothetical protein